MLFTNPITNEKIEVDFTVELHRMLEAASPDDCSHADTKITAKQIQGGNIQIKHQCLICGQSIGNALPKSNYPDAPPFDEGLLRQRNEEIALLRWKVAMTYIAKRDQGDLDFQRQYQAYLASPEWRKRRTHVLKRCGGICEGCMEQQAAQIHHLTYKHFGNEFLFELVGLCELCHARIHGEDEFDESDSRLCRGCRFQGDGEICPVFEVPEAIAILDDQFCGPSFKQFEPLR